MDIESFKLCFIKRNRENAILPNEEIPNQLQETLAKYSDGAITAVKLVCYSNQRLTMPTSEKMRKQLNSMKREFVVLTPCYIPVVQGALGTVDDSKNPDLFS